MSTAGNRGKVAESLVSKELTRLSNRANFDYERVPDSRSSLGHTAKEQTGDYQVWYNYRSSVLEVKEVNHEYRLPRSNFKQAQRARMVKRSWTGCECTVLVYFTPIKAWRVLPISYFGTDDTGSWDMSSIPVQDLKTIVTQLFGEGI